MLKQEEWSEKKHQFLALWKRCQETPVDEKKIVSIWERLTEGYSEPHRFYHTTQHILECLKQFEQVKTVCIEDAQAVELAIWFHDVILDPAASDNEQQSMMLFRELAKDNLPNDLIETVSLLIISTMHIVPPSTKDEACLQDIDISSFAYEWDDFLVDVENLFKEANHQSEETFNQSKRNFYNMLLSRDKIYSSDYFYEKFEAKARSNIERYLREKL